MKKVILRIEGMHCVSCETLLEKELGRIDGLKSCTVSHRDGRAEIECDEGVPEARLVKAVGKCGYSVAETGANGPNGEKPKEKPDYPQIALIALGLGLLSWVAGRLGVMRWLPDMGEGVSVWTALPMGVAASLSTCLALTGGIVMSLGAKVRLHEGRKRSMSVRVLPHLYFHAGRVGGFVILGGLLGLIGSKLEYSLTFAGYLTMFVAVMMFYMGLNILGIVPNITRLGLHLPKSWGKRIHGMNPADHHLMPALIGALTFFLPCGFTQTMQIAAAASGSVSTGALIMGLFAVGTMPVLLGVGVGSTYAFKDRMRFLYRTIGVVVLYFALYSFSSGLVLAGSSFTLDLFSTGERAEATVAPATQVVDMEVDWTFSPSEFRVRKGVPVVWQIYGRNITGCSNEIIIPSLGIRERIEPGPNVITFTPEKEGVIPFSCWMGMLRGRFIVTE